MATTPSHPKPFTKAHLIEECKKLGLACSKWDKHNLLHGYLTGKTVSELQHICKDRGFSGYSLYNKTELIEFTVRMLESVKAPKSSHKKDKNATEADDSPPDGAEKKPRKNSDPARKLPQNKDGDNSDGEIEDDDEDYVDNDDVITHGNVKVSHIQTSKGEDGDSDYVDEDPSSDYDENGMKRTKSESRKNKQKVSTTPQKEKTSPHEDHLSPPKTKTVSHTSPHKSDKTHHENETHSAHHSHHHSHGSSHKDKTGHPPTHKTDHVNISPHKEKPPHENITHDDESDDPEDEEDEDDQTEISDPISTLNLNEKTTSTTTTTKISVKKTKITAKNPAGGKHATTAAGASPKKKKEKITDKVRRSCFKIVFADKLQGKCPVCKFGTVSLDLGQFQAAHILAEAKGGQVTPENLVPSCGCNQIMGTTNLFDYMGKSVEMRKNVWELAFAYWTACIPRAQMEKDILKYGKKFVLVEFIKTKYGPEDIENYKEWLEIPESFTVFST